MVVTERTRCVEIETRALTPKSAASARWRESRADACRDVSHTSQALRARAKPRLLEAQTCSACQDIPVSIKATSARAYKLGSDRDDHTVDDGWEIIGRHGRTRRRGRYSPGLSASPPSPELRAHTAESCSQYEVRSMVSFGKGSLERANQRNSPASSSPHYVLVLIISIVVPQPLPVSLCLMEGGREGEREGGKEGEKEGGLFSIEIA